MDDTTRTERLGRWLAGRPDPGAGTLEERVVAALAAVETFGRAEVEVCVALGDAAVPELCRRLGIRLPIAAPVAPRFPKGRVPEDAVIAEVAALLASNEKFRTRLAALPQRIEENDKAYGEMLVKHYHSRQAKEELGIRPAALLASFVELWIDPDLRDVATVEYSLHLL